jgi:hypothetical protein
MLVNFCLYKMIHREDFKNWVMLFRVHLAWVGFELITLVVIGTDCIGSCQSNYHMIKIMTVPNSSLPVFIHVIELLCYNWRFAHFWLEIWSRNWRFFMDVFIDVFDTCFYCLFPLFVSVLNQLHPISICIVYISV